MKYVIVQIGDTRIFTSNSNTWEWDDNTGMLNVYSVNNEIVLSVRQDEVLLVIRVDREDELEHVNEFLDNLYKK